MGGIGDVILDGECGPWSRPRIRAALAAALIDLGQDRAPGQLGEGAARRAEDFSITVAAMAMRSIYDRARPLGGAWR